MTKREMGNYFGFGLGLCSYVLFWFVLGKAEYRERERAKHRVLENCLWVWFMLAVYCVWRNLWDKEEDDEEGDGKLFWFWFGFVLICTILVCVGKGKASWKGKGRASGFRRLLLHFFFKCYFFNNMLMWKFVGTSKVSVLYIYRWCPG